jgi:hypothetical protein
METLAAQPLVHEKTQKSFDVLASVDMMRFDLQQFGCVLPETRQRVYDEELSSIAEGIERASRTEFVLAKKGNDLAYFDRGNWRSYTGMLQTGQKVAHGEAAQDFRRAFLADWSDRDLRIGYDLRKMQPGDVMSWTNSYPHEQERHYGTKFIQQCGLFPRRKMGFIYRAECLEDGSVVLQSQTVDGSYADGFMAVAARGEQDPAADMDELVAAYDEVATRIVNQPVYAGRTEAIRDENAWHDILAHQDLVTAMLDGLEAVAAQDISRSELRNQTERLIIGTWKAFKLRLDRNNASEITPHHFYEASVLSAMAEINRGFAMAKSQGDIKVGCGGAVAASAESGAESTDLEATFDSIFGDKSSGETRGSWKWKEGVCRVEACPTRPGKTKVGPCEVCVRCQAKFDSGLDPTKLTTSQKESDAGQKYNAANEITKLWNKIVAGEPQSAN